MKSTTVMNVLTEEKQTFYNTYSLETNLITAIIYSTEDRRKILEFKYREKIALEAKLENISSVNGQPKVYSQAFDMIAYESV
tara:strand:+ start:514 stop:759 length:246 start_codon:yes stop_codon:yes gene_type:complete